MSISPPANRSPERTDTARAGAVWHFLRAPATKADADAALFSVKSFAAAMLAYYIALRIGLPKPFWAIVTVYIVSQTSAGASLSRGVYRLAGTIAGAVATVAIVPNVVNDPIACSAALACWIGLCLFFSLLDRTPRAYAFVLAGYTASLIGFPSVLDPGAVFDTASARVQEISIGILCAVLAHRYVLPKPMTGQFTGKLSATLRYARWLAGDALNGTRGENRHDRTQLAVDLLALQGLATHLPYDAATASPRREKRRLIHDRLARLLPLATEIEERIHCLGAGGYQAPEDLIDLLGAVGTWIASVDLGEREGGAIALIARARLIQKRLGADAAMPGDRLAANLAGHLAEMIGLLRDCDRLGQTIATADRPRERASLHGPRRAKGYVYHRDPWMAGRAALGAIVGILIGCAFWIWSAWPEGGTAVSIFGVCCTLFGNVDAPVPNVLKYMVGLIYGVAISLAYNFVILPQVTDFAVLVAVLAPAFLFAGSLQARPPTTFLALGITLTIPILSGLGTAYAGDFAASLNTVIAVFMAIGFGMVSMSLFQTIPVDAAITRLLHLSRRDVSRRALGGAPNEAHWTSLMIDRTALLLPRVRASRNTHWDLLDDTLRHLRLGHAVGQLRKTIPQLKGEVGNEVNDLLCAIAAGFSAKAPRGPVDPLEFDRRIDTVTTRVAGSAIKTRLRVLDLLLDLRFALGSSNTADGTPTP
ncbi:FUSC family protein [Rhodospirillum rubrum]|uniref:Fusaric acid resistance protein conserved region n=1 Tax=Rhodospirillum rubrum (strain ATCC 11170 / ATH 1.1.1 / DSM 467 / LMG 4362 / NCIMB 8255 / S1) TaxID=269796 RepID=Q2RSZ3_RHORT|nr:FUSC family protein [Rhodospirillum rubrum]ABC22752.1 Fusaric acid resistance protein conserved region [Rhodospirillum rubrum ATCC 11170]MBK5954349.1 FUSC family protein [Rhodospirillum rubrum]QXG78744.1 FUSC family protein [Rhodospirillum rubrum]HAQ00862.1 FUSC family protein [Rhodospirillum rubrum]HCF17401.1 FUSC family protein [Rhodospirillum rubrum]